MSFGIHRSPAYCSWDTKIRSLICKVIIKLGLSSFLRSKAYAPLPLCLAKPVILKLSLKIALTKFLCSTSIPIPAICSSIGFVGENSCILVGNLNKIPLFFDLPFPGSHDVHHPSSPPYPHGHCEPPPPMDCYHSPPHEGQINP